MNLNKDIQYTKEKCGICKRDKKEAVKMIPFNKRLIEYLKVKIVKSHKLKAVCKACLVKDEKELRQKLSSSV